MKNIELSKMLAALRRELWLAQQEAEGKEIQFAVNDVELELQLTMTEEGSGKAGVKFWVVNAETAGKMSSQSLQKIRLKLTPETVTGKEITVADKDKRPK